MPYLLRGARGANGAGVQKYSSSNGGVDVNGSAVSGIESVTS